MEESVMQEAAASDNNMVSLEDLVVAISCDVKTVNEEDIDKEDADRDGAVGEDIAKKDVNKGDVNKGDIDEQINEVCGENDMLNEARIINELIYDARDIDLVDEARGIDVEVDGASGDENLQNDANHDMGIMEPRGHVLRNPESASIAQAGPAAAFQADSAAGPDAGAAAVAVAGPVAAPDAGPQVGPDAGPAAALNAPAIRTRRLIYQDHDRDALADMASTEPEITVNIYIDVKPYAPNVCVRTSKQFIIIRGFLTKEQQATLDLRWPAIRTRRYRFPRRYFAAFMRANISREGMLTVITKLMLHPPPNMPRTMWLFGNEISGRRGA